MSESKELEVKNPSYLENANPMDADFQVDMADVKVPHLVLAQPNGDALKEGNPAYVENLRAGQFYNSVTKEIYGKTVKLHYVHHFKIYQVMNGDDWEETLTEEDFKKLRSVQFDKKNGFMSPDKPDRFIKENWKFVVVMIDDSSFDFLFMNVKPGGLAEAKKWMTQMMAMNNKGHNVFATEFELTSFLKDSKTSNSSSYQIDGDHIKALGFGDEETYNRVMKIKDQIKQSAVNVDATGGDY